MNRRGLAEYAAEDNAANGVPCWLCNLPERAEVEAAFRGGVRKTTIRRWLEQECGYGKQATDNKVSHHLRNHLG
jgi:hypothetical protein